MKNICKVELSFFAASDVRLLKDIDRCLNSIINNKIIYKYNCHSGICDGDLPSSSSSTPEYTKYLHTVIDNYYAYRKYAKSRHPDHERFACNRFATLRKYLEMFQFISVLDFYGLCVIEYHAGESSHFEYDGWRNLEEILHILSNSCIWLAPRSFLGVWDPFWDAFHLYLSEKYTNDCPYRCDDFALSILKDSLFSHIYLHEHFSVISEFKSDVIQYCISTIKRANDPLILQDLLNFTNIYRDTQTAAQ